MEQREITGACSLETTVATVITMAANETPRSEINLDAESCNMCIGLTACAASISVENGRTITDGNCIKKALR